MENYSVPMTGEDCLDAIKQLARSQGSYGRMLEQIKQMDDESREELLDTFAAQEFDAPVDMVMWLEG